MATTSINATGITFPDATTQTTAASSAFGAGTVMLFVQTAAPTGWTKSTANNDKALRVVSGTASTGGSVAFSTAFASGLSSGATTLDTTMIPSHSHTFSVRGGICAGSPVGGGGSVVNTITTSSTGGGGSHTHTLPSFAVQYVDVIIATKN